MKNKKIIWGLLLVLAAAFCLAGCGSTSSSGKVYYLSHRDGDAFTDLIKSNFDVLESKKMISDFSKTASHLFAVSSDIPTSIAIE